MATSAALQHRWRSTLHCTCSLNVLLPGLSTARHEGESRHDAGAERRQQAEARFQALEAAGAPPGTKCALCHGTDVGKHRLLSCWLVSSLGWVQRLSLAVPPAAPYLSGVHGPVDTT